MSKLDIIKYVVQDSISEDKYILHRSLFDVNIRLLKINEQYKEIINNICE